MNRSMIDRITEAKMYQRKALQALLPESVGKHVEAIEQELTAIFIELAKELMIQKQREGEAAEEKAAEEKAAEEKAAEEKATEDKSQSQEEQSRKRTKKVMID